MVAQNITHMFDQFICPCDCNFEIKAGFVDGSTLDKAGVEELAALPSKEQLIAKMLGSLQSSLYGLAYVLQAYVDKQNEEAAA